MQVKQQLDISGVRVQVDTESKEYLQVGPACGGGAHTPAAHAPQLQPRAALVSAARDPPSNCIPSGTQHKRSWGSGGGSACALVLPHLRPWLAPAVCSPGCALALPHKSPGWCLLCAVVGA